jgi:ribosomal protein L37E
MRTDEQGQPCPATLGEYRDLVFALVRDVESPAVKMLDEKIAEQGRDELVLVSDYQMRVVLFELMRQGLAGNEEPPSITCPRCGMTSYHPKDISERYCGACHQFHEMMTHERLESPKAGEEEGR